jgi:hypothetical protein
MQYTGLFKQLCNRVIDVNHAKSLVNLYCIGVQVAQANDKTFKDVVLDSHNYTCVEFYPDECSEGQ